MPAPDFQSEPVAHYSVEAIKALTQIGGSKSHVNPGCRAKSKHKFRILPVPLPPDAAAPRQSPGSTRCVGPWPIQAAICIGQGVNRLLNAPLGARETSHYTTRPVAR